MPTMRHIQLAKALKESYQAVWEVNTIAAVRVLSMNALLFFGLLTGESKELYWDATPYSSIEWWAMIGAVPS